MTTAPLAAPERRRYRKVYARLWLNPAFRRLTDGEKLVAIYLLSGPQTNRIGIYKLSLGAACDDLSCRKTRFLANLGSCCGAFGWFWDKPCSVLWIPSWWSFNPPAEKANNFKGALTDLNDVPPSELIARFCNNLDDVPVSLHGYVLPWVPRALSPNTVTTQSFHSPSTVRTRARASQELELEQELEQESTRTTPAAADVFHPPVENSESEEPEYEPEAFEPAEYEPVVEPTSRTFGRIDPSREPATDRNYKQIRKAAFEVLTDERLGPITDVLDLEVAVKALCASRRIAYGANEVGDTLQRACISAWTVHKIGGLA